jgi:hypothetical protein
MTTINRICEWIVHYGSGPCLTGIALQGKEGAKQGFICSVGAHLFWTSVFPLTIKKYLASEKNVWQAHLLGFAGGWVLTYFVAKRYLQRVESQKAPNTKLNETMDAISKSWFKDISILFNPGKLFASVFSAVFDSKLHKLEIIAMQATIIPALVAVASHLAQRLSVNIQVRVL